MAALASCLSCWSQLMEYGGTGGCDRRGVGGGWADSWADAEAPPGFVKDGPFSQPPRSHAAAQAPAVLMIAPNSTGTSSPCWLAEEVMDVVLCSLTVWTSWHSLNTHHCYSKLKRLQTKHACECTVPLWPIHNASLTHTHNAHNGLHGAPTKWDIYIHMRTNYCTVPE